MNKNPKKYIFINILKRMRNMKMITVMKIIMKMMIN